MFFKKRKKIRLYDLAEEFLQRKREKEKLEEQDIKELMQIYDRMFDVDYNFFEPVITDYKTFFKDNNISPNKTQ
jgi:two-component SAPR family response regulator